MDAPAEWKRRRCRFFLAALVADVFFVGVDTGADLGRGDEAAVAVGGFLDVGAGALAETGTVLGAEGEVFITPRIVNVLDPEGGTGIGDTAKPLDTVSVLVSVAPEGSPMATTAKTCKTATRLLIRGISACGLRYDPSNQTALQHPTRHPIGSGEAAWHNDERVANCGGTFSTEHVTFAWQLSRLLTWDDAAPTAHTTRFFLATFPLAAVTDKEHTASANSSVPYYTAPIERVPIRDDSARVITSVLSSPGRRCGLPQAAACM